MDGNQQEQIYQGFFGKSYWDIKNEEGITNRESIKNETMDQAILYEILFQEAIHAGYQLDDTQVKEADKQAGLMMEGLTAKQKNSMQITKESLIEVMQKTALADLYYEEILEDLVVDEAMAVSGIYEEEFQEYNAEYLYISDVFYDEESGMIPYSKEEKEAAYQKANALLKEVQAGKDLETLSQEKEGIEYSSISFLEGDKLLGSAFEKAAIALSNGQTADSVVEEEDGYYIIKMMDNNSTQSYDSRILEAIEDAKAKEFDQFYETLKLNYEITIHESVWQPIQIGDLTYDESDAFQTNAEK